MSRAHELTESVYGIKSLSSRELEEYLKRLFAIEASDIIGTIKGEALLLD